MRRRFIGVVIAALVVAVTTPVVVGTTAAPAEATAYRYWSYWHVTDGAWKFSPVGSTGYRPSDGSVEGWRFAVSQGTATAPAPRVAASTAFDTICDDTPAESGRKRVALVVDFGIPADAPSGSSPPSAAVHGSCVSVTPSANGTDTLVAAGYALRIDGGMICGVSGYPSRGCGDVVRQDPAEPTKTAAPTARATTRSGAGAGTSDSNATGSDGNGNSTTSTTGATQRAGSTTTATASATSSTAASASTAASNGALPSADPLESSVALPTLVDGAPAADTSGTSSNPLRALLALLFIALVGGAAFLRTRGRRAS